MLDINVNISNGSCYQHYESPLDPPFLPCGNALAGVQTCCFAGDACLEEAACAGVRDGVNVTYVAGCTNDMFLFNGCPSKPPEDVWAPIAFCDDGTDQWAACTVAGHPSTVIASAPCSCQPARNGTAPLSTTARWIAVNAGRSLKTTAILPTTAGGAMTWAAGFTPTIASTATATTSTPLFSMPTPSYHPPPSTSRDDSVNHKSLAIGLSIGGFAIAVLLAVCCIAKSKGKRNGVPRRGLQWPRREVPENNEDTVPLPKYTRDPSPLYQGGPSSHEPDEQPPAYDTVVSRPDPVLRD